jgi:hypothetical protein
VLDFPNIIGRAAQNTPDKPIVAGPYPLANSLLRRFIDAGVISGYVAENRPDPDTDDQFIRGWWVDRHNGIWVLRNCGSHTLLLLSGGTDHEISGSMLLEALFGGVRRILFVGADGAITREINPPRVIFEKLQAAPANASP